MSTQRQKGLARELIKNSQREKPLNTKRLLSKVGYSENTAKAKGKDILTSEGIKVALEDYGFSEEEAKKVVGQILKKEYAEDRDRLKAADMIFKVNSTYAPEKSEVETKIGFSEIAESAIKAAEAELKLRKL